MGKLKPIDQTAAVIAVVEMREQLIEEIEKAIDRRQSGSARQGLVALRWFDTLAERLGLLDDREWERQELSKRVIDTLSLS